MEGRRLSMCNYNSVEASMMEVKAISSGAAPHLQLVAASRSVGPIAEAP
jgi:hypothetical protein